MSNQRTTKDELWAITSYFNPCGFQRRLANYRLFRERLPMPLVAVELSFSGTFELKPSDAEVLIQIAEGDVMWQKERLLNLALEAVPTHCQNIAWVDSDILVEQPLWPQKILRALDKACLVQAFDRVCYLKRNTLPQDIPSTSHQLFWQPSLASARLTGKEVLGSIRDSIHRVAGNCSLGFAWAARRELLQRHLLYDLCIIGGGDVALACAAFGYPEELIERQAFNAWQTAAYRHWALPFGESICGNVGVVDTPIYHLWHGDLGDRQSFARHHGLSEFQFNPTQDITKSSRGTWQWSSDKPLLHEYLRHYFASRHEDGSLDRKVSNRRF